MDKKMMWKAAACAAAVLGMAFMAGCGGEKEAPKSEGAAQGGLVQQIKEKGQLVVGRRASSWWARRPGIRLMNLSTPRRAIRRSSASIWNWRRPWRTSWV